MGIFESMPLPFVAAMLESPDTVTMWNLILVIILSHRHRHQRIHVKHLFSLKVSSPNLV